MKTPNLLMLIIIFLGFGCTTNDHSSQELTHAPNHPNVVVIFLDDAGYSDFEPYGNPPVPTPNVRQLASEGAYFTQFYVPQAICSASRSALLTGCYPGRTGVFGAHGPNAEGLPVRFKTMGERFKTHGYRTGSFGKWHLGDQEPNRPHNRGFDESAGLMYSNDMWKFHPENPEYWGRYPIQYWENGQVTIEEVTKEHQKFLTKWYTEKAVDFIKRHREQPFFLYLAHSMPHVPLFCSPEFDGKSGKGRYADVTMELDWSVGEVMKTLTELGLSEQTIVLFSSDNGPWVSYGNHAGVTPFREAKATSFDGGTRVPCIIRYPNRVPAGHVSSQAFCSIDLMPSIFQLAGLQSPVDSIDGVDISPILTGDTTFVSPQPYYAFSTADRFEIVMSGDGEWKLHLDHPYRRLVLAGNDGMPGKYEQLTIKKSLFNLKDDPYETKNVILEHPQVLKQLEAFAENHRQQFYADAE